MAQQSNLTSEILTSVAIEARTLRLVSRILLLTLAPLHLASACSNDGDSNADRLLRSAQQKNPDACVYGLVESGGTDPLVEILPDGSGPIFTQGTERRTDPRIEYFGIIADASVFVGCKDIEDARDLAEDLLTAMSARGVTGRAYYREARTRKLRLVVRG